MGILDPSAASPHSPQMASLNANDLSDSMFAHCPKGNSNGIQTPPDSPEQVQDLMGALSSAHGHEGQSLSSLQAKEALSDSPLAEQDQMLPDNVNPEKVMNIVIRFIDAATMAWYCDVQTIITTLAIVTVVMIFYNLYISLQALEDIATEI